MSATISGCITAAAIVRDDDDAQDALQSTWLRRRPCVPATLDPALTSRTREFSDGL